MTNSFVAILVGIAVNGIIVTALVSLVLGIRARRGPRHADIAVLGNRLETRLDEMARAIDSIAVEVERIGEAQRYLLLDRQSRAASPEGRALMGRSITPH